MKSRPRLTRDRPTVLSQAGSRILSLRSLSPTGLPVIAPGPVCTPLGAPYCALGNQAYPWPCLPPVGATRFRT